MSEYLNWKFRDVKPDGPAPALTPRQKLANWWHYSKWFVLGGAVLLGLAADLAASALGVGQMQPDYQIAYVGSSALPEQTVQAVENAFAALGGDANGDGQAAAVLHQYLVGDALDENADYTYANQVTLMADLESCDSYFFLLENAETFQADYQILADADGTLNEGGSAYSVAWGECPALASLDLGGYTEEVLGEESSGDNQDRLAGLQLARRGFWGDKTCENPEACDALWDTLMKGVGPA